MLYTIIVEVPDDYPQDDLVAELEYLDNINLIYLGPTQPGEPEEVNPCEPSRSE